MTYTTESTKEETRVGLCSIRILHNVTLKCNTCGQVVVANRFKTVSEAISAAKKLVIHKPECSDRQ